MNNDPYYDIEEYWDTTEIIDEDEYDILCEKIDNDEPLTNEEYNQMLEYEGYIDDVILAMRKSLSPTALNKISQSIMEHKCVHQ